MGPTEDRRTNSFLVTTSRFVPPVTNAGLLVLVPGLAQWKWGQRERGLVYLVSFLAALASSGLCWGHLVAWVFLGFAFLTHSLAIMDAFRQRAFPNFPRGIALAAIGLTVGLTTYVPFAAVLWVYAFPVLSPDLPRSGYLVNCRAYQQRDPAPGEWIWMSDRSRQAGLAGQVIAVSGQEVEWTGRHGRSMGRIFSSRIQAPFPFILRAGGFRFPGIMF